MVGVLDVDLHATECVDRPDEAGHLDHEVVVDLDVEHVAHDVTKRGETGVDLLRIRAGPVVRLAVHLVEHLGEALAALPLGLVRYLVTVEIDPRVREAVFIGVGEIDLPDVLLPLHERRAEV